ncbi:CGNR zinc finger domain-containing protein [Streptomyces corynorhini]|uniref:CGNR zinc finger domain-containing protein n=1 Tax=Streptomyces corynorhini TaxID=2282652 RepID=A0A370BEI4_9ACTN|nr:CGNR zinc finger domain-containing protein [Streptomyces corynorhini]RDG38654.1 CGNR zinc finger domain-containing protein [Streptomyces corynorhini]
MTNRPPAPGGLALVQALVNTYDVEEGIDTLDSADGRAAFGVAEEDVPAARELREALRAACLAHAAAIPRTARLPRAGEPPAAATGPLRPSAAGLDRLLAGAPLRVAVDATGAATLRPATAPDGLTSRIAEAIAAGLADGSWERLKACEAEDCQWVFYDRSPAGRGRWCAMSVCGARAKMRAYRARLTEDG